MDLKESGLDNPLKRYVSYNQQIPGGLNQAYFSVISEKAYLTPHMIESGLVIIIMVSSSLSYQETWVQVRESHF